MAYVKCSKCGCFVEEGPLSCPECGNKLEYTANKKTKKKRKKHSHTGWIIALAIIIALGIYGKREYDIYNYGINFHNAVYNIMTSASQLEDAGILYLNVWNNSIYEIQDDETDKYTQFQTELLPAMFYTDFNDALESLEKDEDYQKTLSQAEEYRSEASALMGKLTNPPRNYEEAYRNLKTLYSNYMAFYNVVVNPNGTYSTHSDKFEQVRDKLLEAYYEVSMY